MPSAADIRIEVTSDRTAGYPINRPIKVFTAFVGEEKAGRLYFVWDHETQDQPVVSVQRVDVRKPFRRRGISTALHRAAAEWLRSKGDFRLGSGEVVSEENAEFWEKLERAGVATSVPSGHMTTEWEMKPGAVIPNGLDQNPLLAKPPGRFHRLQDTRRYRKLVGRAPREEDYDGVHTSTNELIASAYAMGSYSQLADQTAAYPVLVTLDVSGLTPLPDVDATLRGAEAADDLLPTYRKYVEEDGWTLDDFIEDDDYREAEASVGETPAAFIFEDTGHHVAQAIRDYAESEGKDEDEVFDAFIKTGTLPAGVLTRMVEQQRYLNDFDIDRVVRIEAIKPWWDRVMQSVDDEEDAEKISSIEARGFHVFTIDDWPFSDVGDRLTLWEAPDADRRRKVEYHGTVSAVIETAFPGLIPKTTPFPVSAADMS